MAMKEQQRSVYRTMQGKEVDMHKLAMQNEMTVAVGNVRVNARGDELGPGGRIVRKREDILREAQGGAPAETRSQRGDHSEESSPVIEPVIVPPAVTTPAVITSPSKLSKKKVDDMDPEGNE